jgi:hypothetical protein
MFGERLAAGDSFTIVPSWLIHSTILGLIIAAAILIALGMV